MKRHYKTSHLMTEINITPLTDVILVLLIIFIVATPLIAQNSIEIQLPRSSRHTTVDSPQQVSIAISGEGVIYLADEALTLQELKIKVEELLAKNPDTPVVVAADRACRFQNVVSVMDLLKKSGVRTMNIASKPLD